MDEAGRQSNTVFNVKVLEVQTDGTESDDDNTGNTEEPVALKIVTTDEMGRSDEAKTDIAVNGPGTRDEM